MGEDNTGQPGGDDILSETVRAEECSSGRGPEQGEVGRSGPHRPLEKQGNAGRAVVDGLDVPGCQNRDGTGREAHAVPLGSLSLLPLGSFHVKRKEKSNVWGGPYLLSFESLYIVSPNNFFCPSPY